jgi:hypothetical protein
MVITMRPGPKTIAVAVVEPRIVDTLMTGRKAAVVAAVIPVAHRVPVIDRVTAVVGVTTAIVDSATFMAWSTSTPVAAVPVVARSAVVLRTTIGLAVIDAAVPSDATAATLESPKLPDPINPEPSVATAWPPRRYEPQWLR